MERKEKVIVKVRFGLCIQKIIANNKLLANQKKLIGVKENRLVTSLRKLAASSGIEFSIIQKISTGKRNPELTTVINIAEGLGITEDELFILYRQISDKEVNEYILQNHKSNK